MPGTLGLFGQVVAFVHTFAQVVTCRGASLRLRFLVMLSRISLKVSVSNSLILPGVLLWV